MSRIGERKLTIPSGVEVNVSENTVTVKGVKGELSLMVSPLVKVSVEEGFVKTGKASDTKKANMLNICFLIFYKISSKLL